MHAIAVTELRSNLMKVIKEIKYGASINITSRGKIVAKLVPPDDNQEFARNKLSEIRKTAEVYDVISPIDVEWKAI